MAFDQIYWVYGGEWKDFSFSRGDESTYVEYGPFYSYQDAYDTWKEKMWLNVDNALYRLLINELDLTKDPKWRNSHLQA